MRVELFEMDYSVSPGGVNCWEADVFPGIGKSINYSGYKTAGDAINDLLSKYPARRLNVAIVSLEHYNSEVDTERNTNV